MVPMSDSPMSDDPIQESRMMNDSSMSDGPRIERNTRRTDLLRCCTFTCLGVQQQRGSGVHYRTKRLVASLVCRQENKADHLSLDFYRFTLTRNKSYS